MMHRTKRFCGITPRIRYTLFKRRWWVVYLAHGSRYDVR